jgi:DNA-binding NarL/FixJ family response regulator
MILLLIEDSPLLRAAMARMLNGHTVMEAGGINEARDILETQKVEVIVLDLGLLDSPDWKTTASCIPEFRSHAAVLVCTGSVEEDVRHECLRMGADGFIVKNQLTLKNRLLTAAYDAIQRHSSSGS